MAGCLHTTKITVILQHTHTSLVKAADSARFVVIPSMARIHTIHQLTHTYTHKHTYIYAYICMNGRKFWLAQLVLERWLECADGSLWFLVCFSPQILPSPHTYFLGGCSFWDMFQIRDAGVSLIPVWQRASFFGIETSCEPMMRLLFTIRVHLIERCFWNSTHCLIGFEVLVSKGLDSWVGLVTVATRRGDSLGTNS